MPNMAVVNSSRSSRETTNETSPLISLANGDNNDRKGTSNKTTKPWNQQQHSEDQSASSNGGDFRKKPFSSIRDMSHRLSSFIQYHTGSIGMLGSISISVNALTGPAMLGIPALFARSGIIPTCCTVIFVALLSAFCSLHMANSISKVQGNGNFKREVEYSDAFQFFCGPAWFNLTQAVFFGCILCLNISSIVDTAQVVDTFFGNWWPWGGAVAIEINGENDSTISFVQWDYSLCTDEELVDGSCTPFDESNGIVLTLGMLIVNAMFMPLALLPLKENAWWQVVAFIILIVVSIQFIVTFWSNGLNVSAASLWGDDWNDLVGVILFNFALVIAVPAWLYEREPDVDVPTIVHGSCAISSVLYILIGILGQMALPNVSDNMLQSMMGGALGVPLQLGASIFAFAIVGLGIPLFSVLTRLNLVSSGLCSPAMGNVLSVYLPFGVSWFLYDSQAITKILSWGGMIFTSLIAFILPIILTIHVNRTSVETGSVDVYFGLFKSKGQELISLRVLLVCAVSAVVVAVIGNIM